MSESLGRLAILMSTLTAILWINANAFDANEIKILCGFFLTAASVEGGTSFLKGLKDKKSKEGDS